MNRKNSFFKGFCSFFPVLIGLLSAVPAYSYEIDFETDHHLPIVYVNVVVKGGSVTDPDHQTGLTNFMGEMLLRGTQKKSKEQIDLSLDQMGAKLAVETRTEAMIFRGAVLSSQLEPFLSLLNEILTQPTFPVQEIQKLKLEIISALQEELGHDSSLASRRHSQFLFGSHPYGKPVVGKIRDIEEMTQEKVIAHYNRMIRDPQMLVLGTGDASSDQISDWAKNLADQRPKIKLSEEESQLLKQVSPPQNPEKRRLLITDKPERTQTQINLGQIGIKMTDDNFFPLYLGNYAFGGGSFSAMLMVEIRVKRGWSYGANSIYRFGLQPRLWNVHLFPAEKDTASAVALTLQMVQDLKNKGITQDQFDFSKKSLVNGAGFMYNTPRKRVENKIIEKTLDLSDGFMKSYGDKLKDLSLSDTNSALKKFLKPDRLSISVLGTAAHLKESLMKAAGVTETQVEVRPYTED